MRTEDAADRAVSGAVARPWPSRSALGLIVAAILLAGCGPMPPGGFAYVEPEGGSSNGSGSGGGGGGGYVCCG